MRSAAPVAFGSCPHAGIAYANPHAPTTIGGVSYTYDNNGNVTSYGTTTVTWDYRNRITKIVGSGATTTFTYDINNERIQLAGAGSTTTFPFMLYNVASSTSAKIISKHLFANGEGIADVQGTGASAKAYDIHSDHAGGADIVSNASSTMENEFAYHAFGKARIKKTSANLAEQRQYIGEEYDQATDLNYHHARYYNSTRGQFLSEEPISLSLGDSSQGRGLSRQDQQRYLGDPQLMNSYSYARNNPIALKDPSGFSSMSSFWSYNPDPNIAAAKQQLAADLRAGYQGMATAAKVSGAIIASGAISAMAPEAIPYVAGGWVNAASSAYEDYQNGTVDKSGNTYATAFGFGAMQESRLIQSGSLTSVLAKSTAFSAFASSITNDGVVSARSLVSNAAGALAGRITQTAMSYVPESAQRVLLTQLSQAVASLAAQIGTLQAMAPSQSQSSK